MNQATSLAAGVVPLMNVSAGPELFRGWAIDESPPPETLTISSVVNCLYAGFSGLNPLSENRERILGLCAPCARVMITQRSESGVARPCMMTMPEYLDSLQTRFPGGDLHAVEVARKAIEFGAVGHVQTIWRSTRSDRKTIVAQGLASLQLFHDSRRWWLLSYLSDHARSESAMRELMTSFREGE
jgi:hypothetical protein